MVSARKFPQDFSNFLILLLYIYGTGIMLKPGETGSEFQEISVGLIFEFLLLIFLNLINQRIKKKNIFKFWSLSSNKNYFINCSKALLLFLINEIFHIQCSFFFHLLGFVKSGKVKGKIIADDNPLPYVNISVTSTLFGTFSDEKGYLEIAGLQPGSYKLKFSAVGYKHYTHDIDIKSRKTIELNIIFFPQLLNSVLWKLSVQKNRIKRIPDPV